jgi:hypothetical protein
MKFLNALGCFKEPETKKLKKNKSNEQEATKTNDNESKKTKKVVRNQKIITNKYEFFE